MRPLMLMTVVAVMVSAPAGAQGVFDMGGLTATLSTDAVTLAEEKRSGTGRYAPAARTRQTKRTAAQNCALRPQFKRKFGANHPDSRRFDAVCKQLGY